MATSVNRHVNIKIDCEARMTVNSNWAVTIHSQIRILNEAHFLWALFYGGILESMLVFVLLV